MCFEDVFNQLLMQICLPVLLICLLHGGRSAGNHAFAPGYVAKHQGFREVFVRAGWFKNVAILFSWSTAFSTYGKGSEFKAKGRSHEVVSNDCERSAYGHESIVEFC